MPKKAVRNAFYFYMKELEGELRREGRVFPNGMSDIVPIAHPRWKALPDNEKERFEKMNKEYKAKMRGAEGDKYRMDNVGNFLANRKDEVTELSKRRQKERRSVIANWPPGKALADEVFYIINFQYQCKTEEGDFLPCEIGLVEYSLKDGITKKLHRFIEPGRIPTGYRFTCQSHSDDNHQIPIENFELADSNYLGLWNQLENFVNPNQEKPAYPPIYCFPDDAEAVEYCLQWVCERTRMGGGNRLKKVFDLVGLVQDINSHIGQSVSPSSVAATLTSSVWDYEPKTRCDFHEEKECKFCALGIVQRYAFAISDCLCKTYDINLTPKHLPVRNENSLPFTALPPSATIVDPYQDSRLPQRGRGRAKNLPVASQARKPVPQQKAKPESDSDSDDSEEYAPIRRPNMPASSMMGAAGPWASNVSMKAPPGMGGSDWPGLGRGAVTVARDEDTQGKFAGRSAAPAPNIAPTPPAAWQQAVTKETMPNQAQTIQNQIPTTIPPSRPLMQPATAPSQNVPQQRPLGPRPIMTAWSQTPQRFAVPQQPSGLQPRVPGPPSNQMSAPIVTGVIRGRGRGILGNVMKYGTQNVPVGRGYAPPGFESVQTGMQGLSM